MKKSTTEVGRAAENKVALWLKQNGYKVTAQNWRIRQCEIDLIAYKDKMLYFVEVKYRRNNLSGTGLEFITADKLKRMAYAAKIYTAKTGYTGSCALSVAQVSGENLEIKFIERLDS